jgi:hypothetical protein
LKRSYSERTIKLLFGRAVKCAYPRCDNPLVFEDRGVLSVSVQIAHIRSESVNGPRFDPSYPEELIDQEENLLLLCGIHHKPVDDHASVYPTGELLEWKRKQVVVSSEVTLTEPQIADVIRHYDLNSLEPMGFEKLCQALTVGVLGPGTKIHGGYGPDGGRDASLTGGSAAFPSRHAPWDGYIVMQAAFKPTAGTSSDAAWLRQWIMAQVRKWAPNHRPAAAGAPADYLILATNVSLRVTHGLGASDRVNDLIRHVSGDTLKGWQVWDEAKIFELLDAHDAVRTAFAPLMTSSRSVTDLMDTYRRGSSSL